MSKYYPAIKIDTCGTYMNLLEGALHMIACLATKENKYLLVERLPPVPFCGKSASPYE